MNERTIVPLPQEQVAIDDVKRLANIVLALRREVFKEGHDFGIIPNTGDKPTLFQPGMEKLMRALRVKPRYTEVRVICDYDRPLFHYEYKCELVDVDTGLVIPGAEAIGLCTSMEGKYRYRNAARVCPNCGKETIIKGKEEYGGGWICFTKKQGCGAKFKDGDQSIEGQVVGRIENPDIFDQINTICKMAQKRALGSAVKGAANVSEFFTVDLEDFQRYDTAPVTVSHDDGRKVDVETGEVVEPPAPEIKIAEKPAAQPQSITPPSQLEQPASDEPDPLQWVDDMREAGEVKAEALPQTDDQAVMMAVNHKYASHRKHYENTVAMLMREGTLDKEATPAQKYMAVKARAEAKQTQKESA